MSESCQSPAPVAKGAAGATSDVVRAGIYWQRDVYDMAQSEHLADLEGRSGDPGAFVEWLRRALEEHATLTPEARMLRVSQLPDFIPGRRFNNIVPLPADVLEQIHRAIVEDRETRGRAWSRSSFVRDAVLVAIEDGRRRRGGISRSDEPGRFRDVC